VNYKNFRVEGRFRADFLPGKYFFGNHELGLNFRHKELSRNNLIYVVDILGIGDSIASKMNEDMVLNPIYDWTINHAFIFQDIDKIQTQGNPNYMDLKNQTIEFSRFNLRIKIQEDKFSLRRFLPDGIELFSFFIALFISIILTILLKRKKMQAYIRLIWFLQIFFMIILLISMELLAINFFIYRLIPYYLEVILQWFDVIWWLVAGYFINRGMDIFVWMPIEKQTNRSIPNLVRAFIKIIIYVLIFFAIIAFVFDQQITSLLATSGVFAMIIGLAIQMNIANIFSGIAVNAERPFRMNDWIQIGDYEEGKVVNVNWRTTRIQTRSGNIISVPNNIASESTITNYNYPDDSYKITMDINADAAYSSDEVKEVIISAIQSTQLALENPAPLVTFIGFNDSDGLYTISFWLNEYEKKPEYSGTVWKSIWNGLKNADIAASAVE
jgi:branched-chain amino acid transport system substrate-binding protein